MGKILSLDYGKKRIGVALSDELKIIAQAVSPIIVKTETQIFEALETLITKEKVEKIVVGIPLGLEGKPTQISQEVELFVQKLRDTVGLEVVTWNETYSSKLAAFTKKKLGFKNRSIDSEAARILLQEFLNEINP
jgi:putative Holliday junction resolvase